MKKLVLSLVALVTVASLVACGNTKKEEQITTNVPEVKEQVAVQEPEETKPVIEEVSSGETQESEIRDLFQQYLLDSGNEEGAELAEYKIDEINVLSDDEKQKIVESYSNSYFMTDVLARVTYSVRPEDPASMSFWQAGNGEESGDWMVNKSSVVTLRDGKLKNIGTGW